MVGIARRGLGLLALAAAAAPFSAAGSAAPVVADEMRRAVVADDDVCSAEGAPCSFNALQTHMGRKQQEIKLIALGHPRTGSQSVLEALGMLGYTGTQGDQFQNNATVRKIWKDWAVGGDFEPALQVLLDGGTDATTADWPASAAWKELMQRYPDAKLILFTHPKGSEGWVNSFESAAKFYTCDGAIRLGLFQEWVEFGTRFLQGDFRNETVNLPIPFPQEFRDRLAHAYEADNAEMRAAVPEGKEYLEYNVAQGWGPLCEFLGKPVPDVPFPRIDSIGGGNLCKDVVKMAASLPVIVEHAVEQAVKAAQQAKQAKPVEPVEPAE